MSDELKEALRALDSKNDDTYYVDGLIVSVGYLKHDWDMKRLPYERLAIEVNHAAAILTHIATQDKRIAELEALLAHAEMIAANS